jgi:hypothetical protein
MYEANSIGRSLSGKLFYTNSEGVEVTDEMEGFVELEKEFLRKKYQQLLFIMNNIDDCSDIGDFYNVCYPTGIDKNKEYRRITVVQFIQCWTNQCIKIGLIGSDIKTWNPYISQTFVNIVTIQK